MTTEQGYQPVAARDSFTGSAFFRNLSIGSKLTLGFGLLIGLILLVVSLTYAASETATSTINDTSDVRVPAALVSSRAQANLLQMFADVRGYLALGDRRFITSYRQAEDDFQANLDELQDLSSAFDQETRDHLTELEQAFQAWQGLPDTLFPLRDDQMAREPAYRWLNTTGTQHGGQVLLTTNELIAAQAQRTPSAENTALLEDLVDFRSSFTGMFAGLRGYVTTRNVNFRHYEYEFNREINEREWQNLLNQRQRFTPEQQAFLETIRTEREQLITQVPTEIFDVLESDAWREDLYRFDTEVEPLTRQMHTLLLQITTSQQTALERDLAQGSSSLNRSRQQSLLGGVAAVLLGSAMAFVLWRLIIGPVRRLTLVAHQIEEGDLQSQAQVESRDEIGTFARTFNRMTTQLRQTMQQIRREKKRADDLLDVVIPIGVALSSERNFNQLLENMLAEAMAFCNADGGAILLRDDKLLRLMMLRITSREAFFGGTSGQPITLAPLDLYDGASGAPDERYPATYVVAHNTPVNIADSRDSQLPFETPRIAAATADLDYEPVSLLALPLKNTQNEVLGVLQLFNAQDPATGQTIPFDANLQQMMASFSSLAVAALESYIREQSLRQEIQQLRIQVDENKQQEQVSEIVETDFFQDLQARARTMRRRNQGAAPPADNHAAEDTTQ